MNNKPRIKSQHMNHLPKINTKKKTSNLKKYYYENIIMKMLELKLNLSNLSFF